MYRVRSLDVVLPIWLRRVLAVIFFALLTAIAARISIPLPFTPVPITLQVLAVILAGLVLGPADGAFSQAAYLIAIAAGLPLDARGIGAAALVGPTAGYLVGFVPAAAITGWLASRGPDRLWLRWAAGLAGVAVIYVAGTSWLALWLGGDLGRAWAVGAAPFVLVDLAKAAIAAVVAEGGRLLLR